MAFRRFVNTVGVIAVRHDGVENAMAAEWTTPISISPRLLGVYVGDARYTWTLVQAAAEFGLSILGEHQAAVSHVLGSYSGRDAAKRTELPKWVEAGPTLGVPLIRGAVAQFECRVVDRHRYGDHILVVGDPVLSRIGDDDGPLLYHGGRYHRLGPEIAKPS